MKIILLSITALFLWSGCSQKTDTLTPSSPKTVLVESESFEDEFESEFEKEETSDPLIGYNRAMTSFNDKVYIYALNPVSKGYAFVVPEIGRIGVSNFFNNLKFPISFTNNLLQLKLDHGMNELARFMLNSTVGILGLIDVADYAGIPSYEEDFGQTLGHYGVGSGFHVVLPFLGSSNLRDSLALGVDMFVSPISSTGQVYQIPQTLHGAVILQTGYYVNKNSLHLGEYESLKKDAVDFYIFLKDSYEQRRDKEIKE